MKLTKITQQKRNIENVNLFLDGEFWCSVSKDQLLEFELHKDMQVSDHLKGEVEEASGLNKIKEAVIKYVSYRPRSEKEIRDNLVLKKGKGPELVDAILSKLKTPDSQLVNDLSFTRWFIENRIHHGTHGSHKIRAELMKKGVDSNIINKEIRKYVNNPEVREVREKQIKDFMEKKKDKIKSKNEYELKQKLSQALMRRGFNYDDFKDFL